MRNVKKESGFGMDPFSWNLKWDIHFNYEV